MDKEGVIPPYVSERFLRKRLAEAEVISIDDYYSNMAVLADDLEQVEDLAQQMPTSINRDPTKPLLNFTKVSLSDESVRIEEEIEVQIKRLIAKSPARRRPLCAIYVGDHVYRGTIDKLQGGMVFIKESFGMIWRKIPLEDIYKVQLLK